MLFSSLNLSAPILAALNEEGYTTPTPIQAKSIPSILEGSDILGCAQTGTGKTAAFALPILHLLNEAPVDKTRRGPVLPRALILSPTRELASQIGQSFADYGRHTNLSHTVIFGGVSQFHQVRALQRGVDILVATPGRLMDLMEQRVINLSQVKILVLDEADRMLDMGFIQPIRRIAAALPSPRHTLLFSATMPREIMHLADSLLKNPVKVAVTPVASAAPLIEQSVYMVQRSSKQALLRHLLQEGKIQRALVFTRTKHGADKLSRQLNDSGISTDAIHGNKAQNQRERALAGFRSGRSRVLVATDVAARGLDVDGITHVFNYDLPNEPESYIHRIGRTGRAGATGIAISFCDGEERGFLRAIEKLGGKKLPTITNLPKLPDAPPAQTFTIIPPSRPANAPQHRSGPMSKAPAKPARPAPMNAPAKGRAPDAAAGTSRPAHPTSRPAAAPHNHSNTNSHAKPGQNRGPRAWSRGSSKGPGRPSKR